MLLPLLQVLPLHNDHHSKNQVRIDTDIFWKHFCARVYIISFYASPFPEEMTASVASASVPGSAPTQRPSLGESGGGDIFEDLLSENVLLPPAPPIVADSGPAAHVPPVAGTAGSTPPVVQVEDDDVQIVDPNELKDKKTPNQFLYAYVK